MRGLPDRQQRLNGRRPKHCGVSNYGVERPSFQNRRRDSDGYRRFWHRSYWLEDPDDDTRASHTLHSAQVLVPATIKHAHLVSNTESQDLTEVPRLVYGKHDGITAAFNRGRKKAWRHRRDYSAQFNPGNGAGTYDAHQNALGFALYSKHKYAGTRSEAW